MNKSSAVIPSFGTFGLFYAVHYRFQNVWDPIEEEIFLRADFWQACPTHWQSPALANGLVLENHQFQAAIGHMIWICMQLIKWMSDVWQFWSHWSVGFAIIASLNRKVWSQRESLGKHLPKSWPYHSVCTYIFARGFDFLYHFRSNIGIPSSS